MSSESSMHTVFTEQRFDGLDLHPLVKRSVREAGFEQLTPIQARSLPLALAGRDVAGQAQTGTGKTAAFLIAVFHRLLSVPRREDQGHHPRSLILAPTRELAIQIHRDAELLGTHTGLRLALAYGGIDYEKQRRQLADGCDVLIGTPGRVIDYFKQNVFNLQHIEVVVLDEADRMFDLGFIKDIRFVLRRMPPATRRLNLLFSATLSYRVIELAYEHMNDPTRIEVETDSVTADKVDQTIFYPSNAEKIPLLLGLLASMDVTRTMVFCNTKAATERVAAYLKANGLQAEILSGDVRQKKRQSLLKQFHDGSLPILVATDVAARGLHIPDVSHVINYDLPQDAEDYVHRVGRTARLGQSGEAVSFACEDYAFSLPEIEAYLGRSIPVEPVAGRMAENVQRPERRPRRPGSGRPGGRSGPPRQGAGAGSGRRRRGRGRASGSAGGGKPGGS